MYICFVECVINEDMEKIDFVVTWLDSTDPVWQKEYEYYKFQTKGDKSVARFRDMNIFMFWFRAVEKYAPWVNKVFLITNGKFPDWINKDNPKLVLVKHEDYIPKEYLPTFNSCTIELNLHRIKDLSEHFVYFNDDVMVNGPITPDYYFKNGLPCDRNKETCFNVPIYTKEERFDITMSMLADVGVVNAHFNRWETVKKSPWRWFGPHIGLKGLVMSCLLMKQRLFVGFSNFHTEQAFLKSSFEEVWEKEPDFLYSSCTRFREEVIANPYVFRYWQFAKNTFYPKKRRFATFHLVGKSDIDDVEKALLNKNYASICLNDTQMFSDEDFNYTMIRIKEMLEKKLPDKSSFEI
jgi:hypothetical protein